MLIRTKELADFAAPAQKFGDFLSRFRAGARTRYLRHPVYWRTSPVSQSFVFYKDFVQHPKPNDDLFIEIARRLSPVEDGSFYISQRGSHRRGQQPSTLTSKGVLPWIPFRSICKYANIVPPKTRGLSCS